jgi:hypothetical protein
MAYIGKSPAVGNFVKLDAISTSSTNSYSLTLDSVAFVPESANHMLVSLNGVIQAPLSSFSVSGSTITFLPSSGTLSSSDSIDFIMVYGNVLDIGTPSDSTVTNAKTNFVSTSSSAGLQIKGDSTTAGTLQLNCEQNSHGVKLRSPAHSSGQSYTLTLPTGNVTADKFLKVASVSGSGTTGIGQLSFADAGGISEADGYRLTANLTSDANPISSNLERIDDNTFSKIGTGVTNTSGTFSFASTGLYLVMAQAVVSRDHSNDNLIDLQIHTTANNSSYTARAIIRQSVASEPNTHTGFTQTFVNVTDTSNVKVRFVYSSSGSNALIGDTDSTRTGWWFIRLGDSQ